MKRRIRTTFAEIIEKLGPRKPAQLFEKETVLIVGEGEQTEPNYFFGVRDDPAVNARFALTVKRGAGGEPTQIVEVAVKEKLRADERGESYDHAFCLIDVEGPGRIAMMPPAIALAEQNGVELIFSNPSFECWYISHFERTCRAFRDGADVMTYLDRHWRREFDEQYQKADKTHYKKLNSRLATAVTNTTQVREKDHEPGKHIIECNSATEVYKLLWMLRPNPLPPLPNPATAAHNHPEGESTGDTAQAPGGVSGCR